MRRCKIRSYGCSNFRSLAIQFRYNRSTFPQNFTKLMVLFNCPHGKIRLSVICVSKLGKAFFPILCQALKAIRTRTNHSVSHMSFKELSVQSLPEIHGNHATEPFSGGTAVINALNASRQFLSNNIFGTSAPNNTAAAATVHKRIRAVFGQFAIILFKIVFRIQQ